MHAPRPLDLLYPLFLVVVVCLIAGCVSGGGISQWRVLESPNYEVFFPPDKRQSAREALYHLEENRETVNEITGSDMREGKRQVVVALEDFGLAPGGFADSVADRMAIFTGHPSTASELSHYRSHYRQVSVHELTHMRQDTNVWGPSRALTTIFGNHFSPNFHSPRWVSEGLATYAESRTDPQEGRLNEGFFDAVVAGRAEAGAFPSIPEITYDHNFYPRGQFYLFGGAFVRYLAERYGRESTGEFISEYSKYFWVPLYNLLLPRANIVPAGGIDRAAEKTFGEPFVHLYRDWRRYEEQRHADWSIDGERVVDTDRGRISNLSAAGGKLYYFRTEVQSVAPYQYRGITHLVRYDPATRDETILLSMRESEAGRIQVVDDAIYFASRDFAYGFQNYTGSGWGTSTTLKRYNRGSGEVDELFEDQIRDFAVRDDGTIVYATDTAERVGTAIWAYRDGERDRLGTIDELVSELHRYRDRVLAVSKKSGGTWDITAIDLESLEVEPVVATDHAEKRVTVSGSSLYYSARYDEHVSVYRRNLVTGEVQRMTKGGYAAEGVAAGGRFYFASGVVDGMGVYEKVAVGESYSIPEQERVEQAYDLDALDVPVREKGALGENLAELVPPDRRLLPVLASGTDALGTNRFLLDITADDVLAAWSTRLLRPLTLSLQYRRDFDDGDEETLLSVGYPVYRSPQSGLSEITLDVETDLDEIVPGARIAYDFSRHRIALRQQVKLDDERDEDAYNSVLTYNYWLADGRLSVLGQAAEGFDLRKPNRTFEIEGVDDEAPTERASVDGTHKVAEVRGGTWNPNLFAGDLYTGVFADWADKAGRERRSGGLQLSLEGGVANYRVVPTVGAAFAADGEEKGFASLSVSF